MDSYSYLFIRLLSACFLCQDANKTRSNCAIIGCSLSKKHKLTLHKAQYGETSYVDNKFFLIFTRSFLPEKPLGQTTKHYSAGWLFGQCIV